VLTIGTKEYCHSGIILIDSSRYKIDSELEEYYLIMNEKELAINVNTIAELNTAERLLYS
jgi:GTP:adenosylcobinamide-phosphate guanylyltransferase